MKLSGIIFLFFWTILSAFSYQAQEQIAVFPFHLDSKLLVFEGKMNGIPTQFAFDTGAGMGMANSLSIPQGRLKVKGKKIRLRDSNNQTQKVKTGLTDVLEIGGFQFEKVRSLLNDMQFLYCMDYYLLGHDVIQQLNWEIDFERQLIRVSKSPFTTLPEWKSFPIRMKGNRPFVSLSFEGKEYPDALVDFGYVSVMDFPDHLPEIQPFLNQKDSLGLSNPNLSTSMGALGQNTFPSRTIWVENLRLDSTDFSRIPIDFEVGNYPKIGLGFFSALSKKTILNHTEMRYYLELKPIPEFEQTTHVGVLYRNGKLILSGKPKGLTPADALIEIGEEIKMVNGFSASDFEDECSFFSWSTTQKSKELEIVKLDGSRLFFPKLPIN
ncbi:hypothetical protein CLV31_106224 [Algoriphagus aquaeductus]|uniref:Aspartyl protease n=1 Tax=Algoriphagus aquaeductus TaxID=475299 RepID=A0A326RTV4_9BACT|nr:retropepsin-like aspartic protease [Algoriphagus aquaeductus]PZV83607.1 hypothetical protein CLV31_106224 [Algoriphagus aquaeductus]